MEGAKGRVQFILADKTSPGFNVRVTVGKNTQSEETNKEIDWTWKIVSRDTRKFRYAEFDEDNFFDALMEVINV